MATVTTPAGDELEEESPAALNYYRREPGYLIDGVDHTVAAHDDEEPADGPEPQPRGRGKGSHAEEPSEDK